jgi:hypothetical protein
MSAKKVQWLVKDLIPENMITLLSGKPGSFKSWFLSGLAVVADGGGSLFNAYSCERCKNIIYIDEDTPQNTYELHLEALALGKIPTSIDQRSMTGFRLGDDKQRDKLRNEIIKLTPAGKVLVLFDCLAKIAVGLNLDRSNDAVKAMSYLMQIRDTGATVVVSHHVSIHKMDKEPMNSTFIKSGTDSIINLEIVPLKDQHIFLVSPESRRVSLTKPFVVKLDSDDDLDWATLVKMDEMPVIPTDDEKMIFKLFPDNSAKWTVKEISDGTGRDLPDSRIREVLTQLVRQLCLKKVVDPHDRSHAAHYELHPDFPKLNSAYKYYIK